MILKKIKTENLFKTFKKVVPKYFAKEEIKKDKALKIQIESFNYTGFEIIDNNKIVGYCFVCDFVESKIIYIDYVMMLKQFQDKGYGTKTIKYLEKIYKKYNGIFCDIENPLFYCSDMQKVERERRVKFYIKNNFIITDVKVNLWNVEYILIYLPINKMIKTEEIKNQYKYLFKSVYSRYIYKNYIKI